MWCRGSHLIGHTCKASALPTVLSLPCPFPPPVFKMRSWWAELDSWGRQCSTGAVGIGLRTLLMLCHLSHHFSSMMFVSLLELKFNPIRKQGDGGGVRNNLLSCLQPTQGPCMGLCPQCLRVCGISASFPPLTFVRTFSLVQISAG